MAAPATPALEAVLGRLEGVKNGRGGQYEARCPAHEDRRQSLSIGIGDDGRVLLHCHAGCKAEEIVGRLGLRMQDLMPGNNDRANREMVGTSDYTDADGRLLSQSVRYVPKGFKQRQPDGKGGWVWNLKGVRRVLYGLPGLVKADPSATIHVCEGEKDCDKLAALGLVATTNAGGAGKWRAEYGDTLRGRHVAILPDNDDPGRKHAQAVAKALHGMAASVKVVELPGLPDKGDVSDWLRNGGTVDQLRGLVEAAPKWQPPASSIELSPAQDGDPDRPVVIVNGRPTETVCEELLDALVEANDPPRLFRRGGRPVRIDRNERGEPEVRQVTGEVLRYELARACYARKLVSQGKGDRCKIVEVDVPPSRIVSDYILARPDLPFPALVGIVEAPVLRPDGSILSQPGYDAATGLYYDGSANLTMPSIPGTPTQTDAAVAFAVVEFPIHQFPFTTDADKANAIGLMLTPVVRPFIRGHIPFGVVDACVMGSGKGLLTDLAGIIATGRSAVKVSPPRDDEEMRKVITAHLDRGSTFISIDNVERVLAYPSLSIALTTDVWEDRRLRTNETIRVPQAATWSATGNNVALGGDLPRRSYRIRLTPQAAEPWLRSDFEIENLREWARGHRGELLAALLTMSRAWIVARQPECKTTRIGGFEEWSRVVGGILAYAGVTGFLANLRDMYAESDVDTPAWEIFLARLCDTFGDQAFTVADVTRRIDSGGDADLREALPGNLADSKQLNRKLGWALRRRIDRRHGPNGLRVVRVTGEGTRIAHWRVEADR